MNISELARAYRAAYGTDDAGVASGAAVEAYRTLERRFERGHHTQIADRHFGSDEAALIVTASGDLFVSPPVGCDPKMMDVFFSAEYMHARAQGHMPASELHRCAHFLFDILSSLVRDHDRNPKEVSAAALSVVCRHLAEADTAYVRGATKRAQTFYTAGVLLGTLVVFGIGWLILAAMPHLIDSVVPGKDLPRVTQLFTACLNAGGAGGILSVMMRMSSGTLRIQYRAGARILLIVGAFRPFIGAVSGVAIYALYQAQLIPISVPSTSSEFFVAGGLAFLAGFSERLAQDALVQTGKRTLTLDSKTAPQADE